MRSLMHVAMVLISTMLWACNADGVTTGTERASSSSAGSSTSTAGITSDQTLQELYSQGTSYVQVVVNVQVTRILADDTDGDQHQKFIVALGSGQTLLVAHNIDIAQRVPVSVGTRLTIAGEYIWNAEGGLLHWTHHDPDGSHVGGYILLDGVYYQ